MSKNIGVITGDLFRSSVGYERGFTYEKVMKTLEGEVIGNPRYNISKMEFFRGDSFQITLSDPVSILELSTYIRAYLISLQEGEDNIRFDARLSVSVYPTNKFSSFNESVFEKAHIDSGRNLEKMKRNSMLEFSSEYSARNAAVRATTVLLDTLISMLSRPQAEVLRRSLESMAIDTNNLAAEMGTTRQNIHKLIARSGTENIIESLLLVRDFMKVEF
ncbi:hypothetical protein [Pectobacterium carotovorum]|uniref:Uncharacterized protein n=1 Tax=Pectobacterium carotovorum subsp. carotovorum TaxID=555 RepID=A0AAI9KYW7_PECCC|nr:hypothetical protein [Pectobacterium carotovorum]GKX46120.1 hypothetical protein SOASR016_08720 [Pectobacterium carotovorum subsp. carotovorum]GLV69106.1 hypothetical protein Pcaca03_15500 [Pectobacterium carotovorum subsp. carotovorum]